MKNIGKYNGIPCYTCTNAEWKSYYNKGKDDGNQIFIIDGVMVCKNKIIGYYDGKHVEDIYNEQPYFVATATKDNHDTMNMKTADEEVAEKEIRFSDYSRVVDEFFASL